MFYSGVYLNNQNKTASIVVIEKDLKSARKLYRICHQTKVKQYNNGGVLVDALKNISHDTNFICKKKVFSQSKRPPKTTWTPPIFVAASQANNEKTPDMIRDRRFSVKGVIYENNKKWHEKEKETLRYGSNYYVNPEEIQKTLMKSCKKETILFEETDSSALQLKNELQAFAVSATIDSDLIAALSVVIWFCERVRQIKRY